VNERKRSLVEALPNWARLSLAAALLIGAPIAFYLGVPMAVTAIVGPLFLVHLWTARRFADYTRADRPVLYWGAFGLFVLITAIAYWELYEQFFRGTQ
jgi:hypothetical protein